MGRRSDIRPLPSVERLNEFFTYDPETGDLRWKRIPVNFKRAKVGDIAGTVGEKGYRIVGLDRAQYLAHRVVWKMMTGEDPMDQVDHKDTDRVNNRWANLRSIANGRNIQNSRLRKDNTSGVKGVTWEASHKAWRAVVTRDGTVFRLGRFKSIEAAASATINARARLHGEFARSA